MTVLRGHCELAPGRPDGFPEQLWRIVSWLLSKDPSQRPARAADVQTSLSQMVPGLASAQPLTRLAAPPQALPVARRWQPAPSQQEFEPRAAAPDADATHSPLTPASQPSPALTPAQPPATSQPAARPRRSPRRRLLVGGLAVVVVAGLAGGYALTRGDDDSGATAELGTSSSSAPSSTAGPTASRPASPSATVVTSATSSYRNPKYGFTFSAPVGWSRADNSDGSVTLTSPDRKSTMRAFGTNDTLASCGGRADTCLEKAKDGYRSQGASVTYWWWGARGENWYIVSGVRADGRSYYERRSLGKASSNVLVVDSPKDQEQQMSSTIKAASTSFRPGDLSAAH